MSTKGKETANTDAGESSATFSIPTKPTPAFSFSSTYRAPDTNAPPATRMPGDSQHLSDAIDKTSEIPQGTTRVVGWTSEYPGTALVYDDYHKRTAKLWLVSTSPDGYHAYMHKNRLSTQTSGPQFLDDCTWRIWNLASEVTDASEVRDASKATKDAQSFAADFTGEGGFVAKMLQKQNDDWNDNKRKEETYEVRHKHAPSVSWTVVGNKHRELDRAAQSSKSGPVRSVLIDISSAA